jgi:hypothetical protein
VLVLPTYSALKQWPSTSEKSLQDRAAGGAEGAGGVFWHKQVWNEFGEARWAVAERERWENRGNRGRQEKQSRVAEQAAPPPPPYVCRHCVVHLRPAVHHRGGGVGQDDGAVVAAVAHHAGPAPCLRNGGEGGEDNPQQ